MTRGGENICIINVDDRYVAGRTIYPSFGTSTFRTMRCHRSIGVDARWWCRGSTAHTQTPNAFRTNGGPEEKRKRDRIIVTAADESKETETDA